MATLAKNAALIPTSAFKIKNKLFPYLLVFMSTFLLVKLVRYANRTNKAMDPMVAKTRISLESRNARFCRL